MHNVPFLKPTNINCKAPTDNSAQISEQSCYFTLSKQQMMKKPD